MAHGFRPGAQLRERLERNIAPHGPRKSGGPLREEPQPKCRPVLCRHFPLADHHASAS